MRPLMHLHILASGSKGNAAIVEGPEGSVLIDCGISRKRLFERTAELGVHMDRVVATIITHEHSDHVNGLRVFAKRFEGSLIATQGTATASQNLLSLPFTTVGNDDELMLAGMHVSTFPTSHDVCDPFGLRFTVVNENGVIEDALGWCTDTGYLTKQAQSELVGCRILGLESNHDVHMLRTGPYPFFLKERVGGRHGHLSNEQCAKALTSLVTSETRTVVALHLSEKNNRPSTCVRTLAAALGAEPANDVFTQARTPDGSLTILAAAQDRPLTIW